MIKPRHRVVVSQVFQDEYYWKDEFDADNLMMMSYYFVWCDLPPYIGVNFIELNEHISLSYNQNWKDRLFLYNFQQNYSSFSSKVFRRSLSKQFYHHRPEFKGIITAGFVQYRDKD